MKTLPVSNVEAALLGLLKEKEMHPYQIEQEVKYRDMRFWTELSMSSIYKLLRKLEGEGYVTRREERSPENRLRKLYRLSPAGEVALKEKVLSLVREPSHTRWPVDIGIYNSGHLDPEEIREALHLRRIALREKIQGYHKLQDFLRESACPPQHLAVAVRPVYLLEAEIKWVNAYLYQLDHTG